MVELSTFNDGEGGRTFQKFFTECQEAQKELAPEGWKTSHRYKFRPADRADGVYEWFDKDRTSVLAAGRAGNRGPGGGPAQGGRGRRADRGHSQARGRADGPGGAGQDAPGFPGGLGEGGVPARRGGEGRLGE